MRYRDKWPIYANEWDKMVIKPERMEEMKRYAQVAFDHKDVYQAIEAATGVPAPLVAVLHRRESDADFNTYLGNGDPLNRVTTHVPRGRGPFKNFVDGAVDALKLDGLDKVVPPWPIEKMLYYCEIFNGTGYNNRGLPSPYIWGGTNIQQRGKYVADGRFNSSAWDTQPGCAPILKLIGDMVGYKYERES